MASALPNPWHWLRGGSNLHHPRTPQEPAISAGVGDHRRRRRNGGAFASVSLGGAGQEAALVADMASVSVRPHKKTQKKTQLPCTRHRFSSFFLSPLFLHAWFSFTRRSLFPSLFPSLTRCPLPLPLLSRRSSPRIIRDTRLTYLSTDLWRHCCISGGPRTRDVVVPSHPGCSVPGLSHQATGERCP